MRRRIGECLVRAGLIAVQDLRVALAEQQRTGERLGAVLVRLNLAAEWQLARALAHQLGLPYTNFFDDPPDPAAVALIPREVASKRLSIGTRVDAASLTMAMADPLVLGLIKDLQTRTGREIRPVVATRTAILRVIQSGYAARGRSRSGPAADTGTGCAKCRRGLDPGWHFCPFCAARVAPRVAQSGPLSGLATM